VLSQTVIVMPESQLFMQNVSLTPIPVLVQQACVPQSLGFVH